MQKLKKMLKYTLLVAGLITSFAVKSQVVTSTFYGQNAWMPDTIGDVHNAPEPPVYYAGKLHQNWGNVQAAGTGLVRFGGIAPDKNMPTNYQYIRMIDSIRAHGMEPIIQVPFCNYRYTAQQAAAIVQYINVTRGKNIKYWSIGNEPDLGYQFHTSSQVAAYIRAFSSAMKAVDPSIKILGPETAWFDTQVINGLTTPGGPDDITGTDPNGHYYVDYITFHFYGFDGSETRQNVVDKINMSGGLKDNLATLNSRIQNCNVAHNRTGLNAVRSGITEANLGYQNPAGDNLYGWGSNSFLGGQFIAEMYGAGMKYGVSFVNMWSVIEGGTSATNVGYLDGSTGAKKPSYYHYQMMSQNMKGTYLDGTSTIPSVKTFGAQNGQNTVVMILNQDQGNNYNYTVKLSTGNVSGNNSLKITINANINAEYSGSINNQSTVLLVFNGQGTLIKKIDYSLATQAANNQPPVVTNYGGAITGNPEYTEVPNLKGFHINLYPNPAVNSKFTIGFDRKNPEEKKFNIEIFDIMGRLVYTRQTVFHEMKQDLDLSGSSFAEAVYIVRVYEDGDKDNVRAEKIIMFK
jgi:hypothetical protein